MDRPFKPSEQFQVVDRRRHGFFWAEDAVFDSSLSPHAKLLYLCLCRVADGGGTAAFASHQRLARLTGLSFSSVRRAVDEIVASGVVTSEQDSATSPRTYHVIGFGGEPLLTESRDSAQPAAILCSTGGNSLLPVSTIGSTAIGSTTIGQRNRNGGATAPPPPPRDFRIPESVDQALKKSPILGAASAIWRAPYWQAEVRANPGLDYAGEILKAEAWITANPDRAPRKNFARFLHTWLGRAFERSDA